MAGARHETETALNVCIQKVLDRTGIKNNQVTKISPNLCPPLLMACHVNVATSVLCRSS